MIRTATELMICEKNGERCLRHSPDHRMEWKDNEVMRISSGQRGEVMITIGTETYSVLAEDLIIAVQNAMKVWR